MKKKTAPKAKANAKTKTPKKKPTAKKRTSRIRAVKDKTKQLLDQSLSQFSPALKEKLEDLKGQLAAGDLRSLGWKALERAREISSKMKTQMPLKSFRRPTGRGK